MSGSQRDFHSQSVRLSWSGSHLGTCARETALGFSQGGKSPQPGRVTGCRAARQEQRGLPDHAAASRESNPLSGIRLFPGSGACWGPQPWHGDAGRSLPQLPLFSESLETKGERSGWKLRTAVQEEK